MELREWAMRIFTADCLEEKLLGVEGGLKNVTDHEPGVAIPWSRPPRPAHLQIASRDKQTKFPRPNALIKPEMRIRCLHTFANHELMALELMAWALLAFPKADRVFRLGLAKILMDEQEHFRLYCDRLEEMGVTFGELPVNDNFWRAAADIHTPLDWVCTMHLTFEQSNLDHAPFYSQCFRRFEDEASAALMQRIFEDEILHVRFGSRWLTHYQPPDLSEFETFVSCTTRFNPPHRARGPEFQAEARRRAGLSDAFIHSLQHWTHHDQKP